MGSSRCSFHPPHSGWFAVDLDRIPRRVSCRLDCLSGSCQSDGRRATFRICRNPDTGCTQLCFDRVRQKACGLLVSCGPLPLGRDSVAGFDWVMSANGALAARALPERPPSGGFLSVSSRNDIPLKQTFNRAAASVVYQVVVRARGRHPLQAVIVISRLVRRHHRMRLVM